MKEDDNIYYMNVDKNSIWFNFVLPFHEWWELFMWASPLCKWYKCIKIDNEPCDHPNHFDPDECFLVEVVVNEYDEEGSPIWERV
jgi:hypothetical protein